LRHEGQNFSPSTEESTPIVNLANNIARKIGYSLFDDQVKLPELKSAKILKPDDDTLNRTCEEVITMMQNTAPTF
jgi:hypothetical protein